MMSSMVLVTTWSLIIGVGMMAGVYFAFSTFIMPAFDDLPSKQAIAAMNSINRVIVKSLFLPLFFGTTLLALVQLVLSQVYLHGVASYLGGAAGLTYLLTMFLCTAVFNVPLNNRLNRFDQREDNADSAWCSYRLPWTRWNHVRTVGSLVSVVLSLSVLASL